MLRACDLSLAVHLVAGILSIVGEQVGALEKLAVHITAEGREGRREEGSWEGRERGTGGEGERDGRERGEGRD